MSRLVFCFLMSCFFVSNAFAIADTIYIDYDLQGGVNNPDNVSSYAYDGVSVKFFPPTKEGAEFLGWYLSLDPYANQEIKYHC